MEHGNNKHSRPARNSVIRHAMRQPLLSRERESQLARAWRDEQDEQSLHELINAYTRLAVSIAAKYRNYGLPMADMVQEGSMGLLEAAQRFEPERGVRFSTYASWWVRSAIQDFILRNWSIVRTGTTAAQKSLFFNLRRLRSRIEEASGHVLGDDGRNEIAKTLGVRLCDVESMEMRLATADQSLNEPYGGDYDHEWQDWLADDSPSPETVTIGRCDQATQHAWLGEALEELSPRERIIINLRRLTEEGKTLEELGRYLGVSKERVRQLEHRALGKLKTAILRRAGNSQDLWLEA